VSVVSFYHAPGCHLCEVAREQLIELQPQLGFRLREVDISGVPELEARYRRWLPVIEVGGERVSVYRLEEQELRRRLDRG
jgi:thiol-disulfide isomerase/thioredoxin